MWGREKRQKGIIQSTKIFVPGPRAGTPGRGHLAEGNAVVGSRAGAGGAVWASGPGSVGVGGARCPRRGAGAESRPVRGPRGRGCGQAGRRRGGGRSPPRAAAPSGSGAGRSEREVGASAGVPGALGLSGSSWWTRRGKPLPAWRQPVPAFRPAAARGGRCGHGVALGVRLVGPRPSVLAGPRERLSPTCTGESSAPHLSVPCLRARDGKRRRDALSGGMPLSQRRRSPGKCEAPYVSPRGARAPSPRNRGCPRPAAPASVLGPRPLGPCAPLPDPGGDSAGPRLNSGLISSSTSEVCNSSCFFFFFF